MPQCHDHKYDPFTQRDYYQLFAYFNNTPLEVENTAGVTWDFYGPTMELPEDPATERKLEDLRASLAALQAKRDRVGREADADFDRWIASLREAQQDNAAWQIAKPESFETTGGETFAILEDGAVLLGGTVPDTADHVFHIVPPDRPITALRVEVLTDEAIPGGGPGRGDSQCSNVVLNEVTVECVRGDVATEVELENAAADFSQDKWDVRGAIDGNRKTGWAIAPQFGKPHWAHFTFAEPVSLQAETDRLRVTLGQYFGRGRVMGKPRVSLYTGDPSLLDLDPALVALAAKAEPTPAERRKLRQAYEAPESRTGDAGPADRARGKRVGPAQAGHDAGDGRNGQTPRDVHSDPGRLRAACRESSPGAAGRAAATGQYRADARPARAGAVDYVAAKPALGPRDGEPLVGGVVRHGIGRHARGLRQPGGRTQPRRVARLAGRRVDRFGLVDEAHAPADGDFGRFRREARLTAEQLQRDPHNRLLARGPRFRLSAELVRDNALAISGLLSPAMYGPPIMPYQPDDLWRSVGRNQPKWQAAGDERRFRRGLYVVWKRAAPYPSFVNFDAPNRSSCTVSRPRTNTPLQALTLLNDPAYAEMSLALADRVLCESPGATDEERLDYALRLAVARRATPREIGLLKTLLAREREALRAIQIPWSRGTRSPVVRTQASDKLELAAWFAVANVILNLDETVTH